MHELIPITSSNKAASQNLGEPRITVKVQTDIAPFLIFFRSVIEGSLTWICAQTVSHPGSGYRTHSGF